MAPATTPGDGVCDQELLAVLGDGPVETAALADRLPATRGRIRARLSALEDRGLVLRTGSRTAARWTLSETGRDRLTGGPRVVADGGDPEETDDDDRFDPEVEEIPVEIGGEDGEWGGGVELGKWKLIGAAVVALVALVVVYLLVRKLRR